MKSIRSSPNPDPEAPCDAFCLSRIACKLPCFLVLALFLLLELAGWARAGAFSFCGGPEEDVADTGVASADLDSEETF